MAGGRPSEFNKIWNNEDGLLRIAGWARDGLSNEQIAKNVWGVCGGFKKKQGDC